MGEPLLVDGLDASREREGRKFRASQTLLTAAVRSEPRSSSAWWLTEMGAGWSGVAAPGGPAVLLPLERSSCCCCMCDPVVVGTAPQMRGHMG
jgi:hypothetical protein